MTEHEDAISGTKPRSDATFGSGDRLAAQDLILRLLQICPRGLSATTVLSALEDQGFSSTVAQRSSQWLMEKGRVVFGPRMNLSLFQAEVEEVTQGSDEDADALLAALGLGIGDANVGVGSDAVGGGGQSHWIVMVYGKKGLPELETWKGWPVTYRQMDGMPQALAS